METPILLEGNEEVAQEEFAANYSQQLSEIVEELLEFVSREEIQRAEEVISIVAVPLIRHFAPNVAIKIKLMLVVGYLQRSYNGLEREDCLQKMAQVGWKGDSEEIPTLLYDLLMQIL